jgi:hypothetical protein
MLIQIPPKAEWLSMRVDTEARFMFRSALGMHYESDRPKSDGDVVVAIREITTTTGSVIGVFPESGNPVYVMGERPVTELFPQVEKGPWRKIGGE